MVTIYGIANCDKCRAARKWFADLGIEHQFHDVRKDGLTESVVADWVARAGIDTLVNKRGKTWRELPADTREQLDNASTTELVMQHPTLTKRPVIDSGAALLVGYDEPTWQKTFKA